MVRQAGMEELHTAAELAQLLWPAHGQAELLDEMRGLLAAGDTAVFLSVEGERAAGFAQCSVRREYVEGASGSPTGYLEGIYVQPAFRRHGRASELVRACEQWAAARGCGEFASDCALDNAQSIAFHAHAGFCEAGRIVCFIKKL